MLSLKQWQLCQKLHLEMAASRSASRMLQKMRSVDENMAATIISGCTGGEPRWFWDGKEDKQEGVIIKLPGEQEAHEYKPGYDDPKRLVPNDDKSTRVWYGAPDIQKGSPPYYTRLRKGHDPKNRKLVYGRAWEKGDEPFDPDADIPPGE